MIDQADANSLAIVLLGIALIVDHRRPGRVTPTLCRLGLHSWDYSGNAHTHAPRPIRCERCRRIRS